MNYEKTSTIFDRHRRLLSLILCLVMLLGCFPVYPAMAVTGSELKSVAIKYDGKTIDKFTLPENERAELTAECSPIADGINYQWQILADPVEELWISIYDGTAETLSVSYAMLEALLDNSGSTYIRCRATLGGDECVSDPVCVTVEYMPSFIGGEAKGQVTTAVSPKKSIRRAATQNGDEKMVGITINYLDGVSGLPIYSAYTGHVNVSEEDYFATVISPTYLGYAPKYDKSNPSKTLPDTSGADHSALFPDSAATIELNITNDTEEQYVVNVYYFAIDVPYAVRYYFQNIHDDQYTEDVGLYRTATAKTGTIISNEKLAELIGEDATIGFTKLYHYPEAVAADGSTVFECYYDRNYRMIKFDTNGGYGVEPIYARYGTPFLVNEPTRYGYVFAGWDELVDGVYDDNADTLPATVPDKNCTYRALWTQANTTYDVAYWLENADDESYSYIGTRKMNALSGITISPTGISADGVRYAPLLDSITPICGIDITEDPNHTHDPNGCYALHAKHYVIDTNNTDNYTTVVVKGDGSTVLNVYYTRKYYTLRFVYAKQLQSTGAYYVVGGSTYGFGNLAYSSWFSRNYSIDELLNNVSDWGEVEALPVIKSPNVEGAEYVTGGYSNNGYNYYYFEVTAQYGADLTELWPADIFGKVNVKNPESHTTNGASDNLEDNGKDLWGKYAYLSGWNGEYKVQYTIDNSNSTIKGLYQKLDDRLLLGTYNGTTYDYTTDPNILRQVDTKATVGQKEVTGSNATYFLAFFDNGANVNWSVPREWIYDLFVPVFSHEVETGSDLYNKIMDAAGNANLADRTYTDPDTNKVYYYQANNKQIYRLYNRLVSSDDNTLTSGGAMSGQTQTSLNGFKFETRTQYEKFQNSDTDDGRDSFTMRFFYTRDDFAITLHSHGEVFDSDTLEFDSEIDDFMTDGNGNLREPPYPDTLEENAYYFDGWYASPECVDGTQYVAGSGYKMPAVDFALYAKWAPKTHTVRFFQTHDDLLRYEADNNGISGLLYTYEVKHGQVLGSVNNPTDKSEYHYSFGGWFYDYVGKRYAYTPLDVPVIRDLNVFAAWGSLTAQPYRIHYALDNPETADEWTELLAAVASTAADNATYTVTNGTEMRTYVYLKSDGKFHLCIADDTEGFAYQGSTRTFSPKVGDPYNQLHEAYNKGYYPTFASHSITMEYEENKEEPQNNVFTFTYVYKETVDYRVEYRYADTGVLINTVAQGGIAYKSTGDGVVTERFVAVPDYIPDAFFKRLILAVEKDENGKYVSASTNVIIFYYTKNTTSAYYAVHYMLQNLGAGTEKTYQNGKYINYTESSAYTEGIGTIGQECAIPPQAFSGFTVEDTALINGSTETALTTNASGKRSFNITVSSNGTELYIFYTRNMQEYSVYYLQYGTDISDLKSLQYTDGSNGVLHETKAGQAQFGATVTESAADVSIGGMTCISALSQSILIRSNNDQNYIIFYYTPVQTTIEYRVWQYGGGALSKTLEVFDAKAGEIEGSTALAMDGYTFEGWYLDEACKLPASTKGTVNGTHLLPNSNLLDVMPQVNVFYAKFLPDNGSLTVVRENGEGDESNGKQVFVYKIQAVSDPDYVLYVTIVGNGSVTIKDLPCREYTVTQQNDWSWRYDDAEQNVTVENEGSTVTFDEAAVKTTWLNGNSRRISNRKG